MEPNMKMDPTGKSTLFNETWIGHFISQEDLVPVTCVDDTEMIWILDNDRHGLKIADQGNEGWYCVWYAI
jgi:hypothetical protein